MIRKLEITKANQALQKEFIKTTNPKLYNQHICAERHLFKGVQETKWTEGDEACWGESETTTVYSNWSPRNSKDHRQKYSLKVSLAAQNETNASHRKADSHSSASLDVQHCHRDKANVNTHYPSRCIISLSGSTNLMCVEGGLVWPLNCHQISVVIICKVIRVVDDDDTIKPHLL